MNANLSSAIDCLNVEIEAEPDGNRAALLRSAVECVLLAASEADGPVGFAAESEAA